MLPNPARDLLGGFQNNMSWIKWVGCAKAHEDQTVGRAWFLSAPSSQCCLLPTPFLTCFLFSHPSIFLFIVSWRDACKGPILPSMALVETRITISNNYGKWIKIIGCFFSKGVTEIECVATIPKIETWSTLEGNEATTPGAVSLVKGSHYPGTINSSVFPENRSYSTCLMEKWNSSISKNGSYSEYFYPTKWFFFSNLLGLEVAQAASWGGRFSGEKSLIGTFVAFTLGALSLGGLW